MIGLLCLLFKCGRDEIKASNIEFVEALSGFAAVTLESRQLFNMQEALLHAFIKLIAGAIDAKSPYTGGHCARVPEITLMLAKAACESKEGAFKGFNLDEKQWKELSIAGWLHDCGKVTTPEYVVDKATKLETIYDRIHEIRMRFEILKRDAEIKCWKQIADGGNKEALLLALDETYKKIDDDFSFIAECNVGGEFMADDKVDRLQQIAEITWLRTMDDHLGLSWEELNRKSENSKNLPVVEKLLSDKPEHLITRHENDNIPQDNPWGFNVEMPEYKYNRGELYNLSVKRGTLSEEERYMINGHMIQTIMMLDELPFPKDLRDVSLIAGSHHETMDGKGYPKKLVMAEQPLTARMMVIADIFEALTASDRPYKKAKTLSESLRILSFMRNDNHIDPDLFNLFLKSGVYLEYAKKFLAIEQIDEVNIEDYLSPAT
jgi:HD-GYP domain-containing protein (c-di-GMP phosphodiesterase class II)